ncbi:CDP-diacylglycerol--serine O-phosphatidyltransferase [Sphingomonas soli]|uniref:CDP-diacylglycerol--serine O-phosphatidyltransferase n=1 Tax=Sphingomonas soli TaxID=266127 RepID=UPI00082B48AC|nr:CDP-diacylglycerol--serine O-phosphatidyltransferase [Sphingomonas soli]
MSRVPRVRRVRGARPPRLPRGIPLRTIAPNAVTAAALCSGLTAIRFAMDAKWEQAVVMVLIAAVLDGIDGKVARLMRGESRFGAELDSLSDAIAFGVAPALILYLWSLQNLGNFGWMVALVYALFCVLRLARFNAGIDNEDQPHKSAGFLTGVPAPAGALLAMAPLYLWLSTQEPHLPMPYIVAPWTVLVALLMISSIATFTPAVRLKQRIRFEVLVILAALIAALISAPWPTLTAIAVAYLATIPFSIRSYRRVRLQRAAASVRPDEPAVPGAP